MSSVQTSLNYQAAVRDFDRARKRAAMQRLIARLTGKSAELLSFAEVEEHLVSVGEVDRGLREIPLDAIVGSVGRFKDFTRTFLPVRESDEDRWARVRTAVTDMSGLDPIDVYQVGEVYFVKDGNHRVSVAHQLGSETISAFVTEVLTRVPLSVDDDPEEIINKSRYADFLERTNLDREFPDADLTTSFCAKYDVLLDQIEVVRCLAQSAGDELTFEAAAKRWYEARYLPVVRVIREQGAMRSFPELREVDLYLLLTQRTQELSKALGWNLGTETVVTEMTSRERMRARPLLAKVSERLMEAVLPSELENGPPVGRWRSNRVVYGRRDRLFADYLVAISGSEADWQMLDAVIHMALYEQDHLLGLHVVPRPDMVDGPKAKKIRARFVERCREAGIEGELAVEAGKVADTIIRRAAWADLVITSLIHRPGDKPLARLGHGFRQLVQRCPRPLIAIPAGSQCRLSRLLLAYDGSPKSDEALFVATYLASRWPISLTVLTVETEFTSADDLNGARQYLEQRGVQAADYVLRQKPIDDAILETAEERDSTMIIMGGFGFRPVLNLVLGSSVDTILRHTKRPLLICR